MSHNEDLWYRLGYALETARSRLPTVKAASRSFLPAPLDDTSHKVLDAFLTVGAGTLLTRLLAFWPGRGRPGILGLVRAGAAGAASAFLAELLRPLLSGEEPEGALEEELTDILLSGAGRGLLYAALVEPRAPGPPALRGSAYGALEYTLTPWGGLEELVGKEAPQGKLPVLSILFRNRGEEESFLAHLTFGILLSLLYEG